MPENKVYTDNTIFMNSKLIAKINKNSLEEIRILLLKNNKVDLRIYVFSEGADEPFPTKKGIWISLKDLPHIIGTLEKLADGSVKDTKLEIKQTEKIQTRVYSAEFKGKSLVHIRTYYLQDNEFKPGKGISFPIAITKDVVAGLKKAAAEPV
jgi:hypothetical protein